MIEPGERPMRPALTRDYILRIALRVVDDDGLGALTMRRLGAVLEVDPMAVYRHLPNKAALLDGVAELVWTEALDPAAYHPEQPWRQQLFEAMCRFREVLLEHPRVLPLMSTHPLVTARQFAIADAALAALETGGLDTAPTTLYLINDAVLYTMGHVLAEVGEPAGGAGGELPRGEMRRLVVDLPHVSRLLESLLAEPAGPESYDPEAQYRMGLRAMIAGWPGPAGEGSTGPR